MRYSVVGDDESEGGWCSIIDADTRFPIAYVKTEKEGLRIAILLNRDEGETTGAVRDSITAILPTVISDGIANPPGGRVSGRE